MLSKLQSSGCMAPWEWPSYLGLEALCQLESHFIRYFQGSPFHTLSDSLRAICSHGVIAFIEDVITKRLTVGTFRAEIRIPVVPLTEGSMISRS